MDLTIKTAIEVAANTVASLYADTTVKMIVLIAALLFCFIGYKLLRGYSAIVGVMCGIVLGTCITGLFGGEMSTVMSMIMTVLMMIVAGLICGLLFFGFYKLGVFASCAAIGAIVMYVPSLFVAEHSAAGAWALLAVCALIFGAAGLAFMRPASILMTGAFGFVAAIAMIDMIGETHDWRMVALGLGLTAAGCVVQFMVNRGDSLPFGRSRKSSSETIAEEKEDADAHLSEPAPQEDNVSDDTHGIDLSQLPQEEPDEIDSISDMVAAHISLGDAPTEPTIEFSLDHDDAEQTTAFGEKSDDPETTDDSTIVMSLGDIEQPLEKTAEITSDFTVLEEIKTDGTKVVKASGMEAETPEETVVHGAWKDVLGAENVGEETPAEESVLNDTGKTEASMRLDELEEETSAQDAAAAESPEAENEAGETEPMTEDAAGVELLEKPQQTEVLEETTEGPEEFKEPVQAVSAEKPEKQKKPRKKGAIWSIVLIVLALAAAAVGVYYAEIVLGLCVLCCAFRRYRVAEFACAILCVRRIVEAVFVITAGESWVLAVPYVLSAVVFLALMVVIMRTAARQAENQEK